MTLDSKVPGGPLADKWDRHRFESKLVNPANRRKYTVIVVGTGLAGASAASSLGELGYNVLSFCIQDSPRRAHSIAAQGGINAAKNYQNDGDSIQRLFYDTVKGGDYRSREANVYRLAQLSVNIIDQCVAQGVPFAREYGGLLDNRSFGGAQVSRTFYARGQTGQQLLLGAYQSMMRQVEHGHGQDRSPTARCSTWSSSTARRAASSAATWSPARSSATPAHAVLLCTGGYGNGVLPLDQRRELERHRRLARAQARRVLRQSLLHADSSDLHSGLGHASVEADADEREPAQRRPRLGAEDSRATRGRREQIPEAERDYYLERRYPSFGNLVPRDVASRNAKAVCDEGRGVGDSGLAVYLDFADAITRLGADVIRARYGNLFDMYTKITDEDPYTVPMRIYPAIHYTMGGLWVDYNLMSTIPGLHVLGEANFSDHGANRLGASALMQGLADGYFVIPYTLAQLSRQHAASRRSRPTTTRFKEAEAGRPGAHRPAAGGQGREDAAPAAPRARGRPLGRRRHGANDAGLRKALARIPQLRDEFWQNVSVPGPTEQPEQEPRVRRPRRRLPRVRRSAGARRAAAHRVVRRALPRGEPDARRRGAARRRALLVRRGVGVQGVGKPPALHKEPLTFEYVKPTQRSYK